VLQAADGVGVTRLAGRHNSYIAYIFGIDLRPSPCRPKPCCRAASWDGIEGVVGTRTRTARPNYCVDKTVDIITCVIKVEAAARVPTMRPCTAGCREMQPRLQRATRSYRLIRPISRQSGAHGPGSQANKQLSATVELAGGGGPPPLPYPPSPPSTRPRLQEIPRSKGVWPSGID
jgi:hypothetical protein